MTAKKKILVAMSGGVDSSVTAALLQERGYEVIGATMRLSEESRAVLDDDGSARQAVTDAKHVSEILGIEHHVIDLRADFEKNVICYFVNEYARGRTPNPCVECNRTMKFGDMISKAKELGADYIATGHYARVICNEETGFYELRKGLDEHKDQSYVLYHLGQDKLSHLILPLGEYAKTEVRKMAKGYGLPVAHKAESQEICFIPDDDHARFLREHRPESFVPGDIVDTEGHVLGRHQGLPLYTIGQRKGRGMAAPEPLYVIRRDTGKNQVVVGGANDVFATGLNAEYAAWITEVPAEPVRCTAKIRYGRREGACTASMLVDGRLRVEFDEPQRAVTPGQSVVLYDGERVLGGGDIQTVDSN